MRAAQATQKKKRKKKKEKLGKKRWTVLINFFSSWRA